MSCSAWRTTSRCCRRVGSLRPGRLKAYATSPWCGKPTSGGAIMLELHEVHTYYGDSYILRGISFTVGAGQCVALLGRNGAGKTTALPSALGLSPIRLGSTLFQGHEISPQPPYRIPRLRNGSGPDN